jgi:hypothetical protein
LELLEKRKRFLPTILFQKESLSSQPCLFKQGCGAGFLVDVF